VLFYVRLVTAIDFLYAVAALDEELLVGVIDRAALAGGYLFN